jgi:5'-methylthioadenosine phosphorylase
LAFSAVGSLREEIKPRDFVVPDQIIDRTRLRGDVSFFGDGLVGHVMFADPFEKELGDLVIEVGDALRGKFDYMN